MRNQLDLIQRGRFAHRTQFRGHADQIAHGERGFRLSETFHDFQPGCPLEDVEHFRIERFARSRGILDRAEVIFGEILADEEPVHRRRRTESRDVVLLEQTENIGGVKAVEVIHENCALAEPLSVEFTPGGFAPAGIGNREMQTIRLDIVPPARRDDVSERIGVRMFNHFGIAGRAGAEIHQGGIMRIQSFHAGEAVAVTFHFGVEIMFAFARFADRNPEFDAGGSFEGFVNQFRQTVIR